MRKKALLAARRRPSAGLRPAFGRPQTGLSAPWMRKKALLAELEDSRSPPERAAGAPKARLRRASLRRWALYKPKEKPALGGTSEVPPEGTSEVPPEAPFLLEATPEATPFVALQVQRP